MQHHLSAVYQQHLLDRIPEVYQQPWERKREVAPIDEEAGKILLKAYNKLVQDNARSKPMQEGGRSKVWPVDMQETSNGKKAGEYVETDAGYITWVEGG